MPGLHPHLIPSPPHQPSKYTDFGSSMAFPVVVRCSVVRYLSPFAFTPVYFRPCLVFVCCYVHSPFVIHALVFQLRWSRETGNALTQSLSASYNWSILPPGAQLSRNTSCIMNIMASICPSLHSAKHLPDRSTPRSGNSREPLSQFGYTTPDL